MFVISIQVTSGDYFFQKYICNVGFCVSTPFLNVVKKAINSLFPCRRPMGCKWGLIHSATHLLYSI